MALNQVGIQNALTVSSAAVSLTVPADTTPTHAIIQVADADIRFRADGTAPTTSAGIVVKAGSNIELMDQAQNFTGIIANFQAIRDGGTDASLEVAFFAR